MIGFILIIIIVVGVFYLFKELIELKALNNIKDIDIDRATSNVEYTIYHQNWKFPVAGTYYYRDSIIKILEPNIKKIKYVYKYFEDYAILKTEPQNEYDHNAIAVYIRGEKVGHVPADLTDKIHPLINKCEFICRISGGDTYIDGNICKDTFKCVIEVIYEN